MGLPGGEGAPESHSQFERIPERCDLQRARQHDLQASAEREPEREPDAQSDATDPHRWGLHLASRLYADTSKLRTPSRPQTHHLGNATTNTGEETVATKPCEKEF